MKQFSLYEIEITKKLTEFLQKHNAYIKFKTNVYAQHYISPKLLTTITESFVWEDTEEKQEYWQNLSDLFASNCH